MRFLSCRFRITKNARGGRYALSTRRSKAALPRLKERLRQAQHAEYCKKWSAQFEEVEAKRDTLAEKLTATYPDFVVKLVDLLNRIKACDKEVDRINSTAPRGDARRLLGVELTARGLDCFTTAQPPIAENLRLPRPSATGQLAFPPPQPNFAVMAAQMAATTMAGLRKRL